MKYYTLFCLLFTIVYVYTSPDSPPTYEGAGEPALPRPIKVSTQQLEQLPSVFTISDELLALKDKHQCMEKLLCLLETDSSDGANNSLTALSKYLTNKDHDIDDESFEDVQKLLHYYPHLESLVGSIKLGQSSLDPETCISAFADCHISKEILLSGAKEFDALVATGDMQEKPNKGFGLPYTMASRRLRRSFGTDPETCAAWGGTCAVTGIGCVVCALLTFGTCGAVCGPIGGTVCAVTGGACTAQAIDDIHSN